MQGNKEAASIQISNNSVTARLRFLFLVPMAIAILLIIVLLSSALHQQADHHVEDGVIQIHASIQDFYEESIRYDAGALKAVLHALQQDEKISAALAKQDRVALLQISKEPFENIKHAFGITHLYFTSPQKVNILRVHAPLRYGDTIERTTTLQAQSSGTTAFGVELGVLGTFTLRVVEPWYDKKTNKLIGYVELGMEMDHVIKKLQKFFDVDVFTLVDKKYLSKEAWEAGMRTLGRTPNWEQFKNSVISQLSPGTIPPMLADYLKSKDITTIKNIININYKNLSYRATTLPLNDADGRVVAYMLLINNVSHAEDIAHKAVFIGSAITITAGAILFVFFYWLVGRIGKRIEKDEQELIDMATRDGLTGLYNHRYFYTLLENEAARSERYGHNVSLLMLDIDHFKNVNDTYGHRAGDTILHDLSETLMNRVRSSDTVCRYGGEEITVILPETDTDVAKNIAEDLRVIIEQKKFELEDKTSIQITISIGVSTFPVHAKTIAEIVSSADSALYEAKQGGRNKVCIYTLN